MQMSTYGPVDDFRNATIKARPHTRMQATLAAVTLVFTPSIPGLGLVQFGKKGEKRHCSTFVFI
jgi:hypothetical protein